MEQLFWQNSGNSILQHMQRFEDILIMSLRATERSVAISRQITRLLHFVRNDNIIFVGTDSIYAKLRFAATRKEAKLTLCCYMYK